MPRPGTNIAELRYEALLAITAQRNHLLMTAGVIQPAPSGQQSQNATAADIRGCFYHTVQISTLNGTDSLKLQVRIGTGTFTDLVSGDVDATLTADGLYEFTGLYDEIKIVRNSGTGTTTLVELRSRF